MADSAHILVFDLDAQIRALVAKVLRVNDYRVSVARDEREMWETISASQVDLVILDIMLLGGKGLDLCRQIRATSAIPIVILTGIGDDTDRIDGIETGVDDYIRKPFDGRDLLARVNAVLCNTRAAVGGPQIAGRRLRFQGWTLDTRRRELTNPDGTIVDLSTSEYELLAVFLQQSQRVISQEVLEERTRHWFARDSDLAVDVQVGRLRKKLLFAEDCESMIMTVKGRGYMLLPTVTRA